MIICPKCGAQLNDGTAFCKNCGTPVGMGAGQPGMGAGQPGMGNGQPMMGQPMYNPFDHTAEYSPNDISDNKVMAMLPYLFSWLGVILVLMGSKDSPYASFHVKQYLKVLVTEAILGLIAVACAVIAIIPILGWIIGGIGAIAVVIFKVVLWVVKIIGFFRVCKGTAIELPIVKNFSFLR